MQTRPPQYTQSSPTSGRTAMISEGLKAGDPSEQITKYMTVAHFSDSFLNTFSLLGPLTNFIYYN